MPQGFGGVIATKESELVTQSELDLPYRADHGETFGSSKRVVPRPSVESPKNMPVESIRYVRFEDNGVVLVEGCSFLDGEVLIEVALAADIAEDQRGIAIDESTLGHQVRRIGVHKSRAIEEIVGRIRRHRAIGVIKASAILSVRIGSVERTVVWRQDRHARHQAKTECSVSTRRSGN